MAAALGRAAADNFYMRFDEWERNAEPRAAAAEAIQSAIESLRKDAMPEAFVIAFSKRCWERFGESRIDLALRSK